MNERLNQYAEQFSENFPIFILRNLNEGEIIQIIDNCINNNKPYEIKTDDVVLY